MSYRRRRARYEKEPAGDRTLNEVHYSHVAAVLRAHLTSDEAA